MAKANGIIGSLLWKSGERIMVQGIGLLVQIILARLLMPEDFASLAIITAIVNYLGIFVQCGLSAAVVQKNSHKFGNCKGRVGIVNMNGNFFV